MLHDKLSRSEGKAVALTRLLTMVKWKLAILRGLLTKVEDTTKLKGSLSKDEEKASLVEHWTLEVFAKIVEAFRKGEDFHRKFLESCQDAYAKGAWWYERKVAKYYLKLDLSMLSSRRSSLGNDLGSSNVDEGGEITSLTF